MDDEFYASFLNSSVVCHFFLVARDERKCNQQSDCTQIWQILVEAYHNICILPTLSACFYKQIPCCVLFHCSCAFTQLQYENEVHMFQLHTGRVCS